MRNFENTAAFRAVYKILVVVVYGLLATPLLLSSKFFFPFISTKTFYFRLLVEVALVLYVLIALADHRFRPKVTLLSGAVYLYTGIIFITSLIGVNFYRSFWGNTERGEGILTFLHIIAFFVILTGIFLERRQWERYFFAGVLVSFAACIYATLQKFGADFVFAGDLGRLSSTIGNAAFFAGYLVANIFIAIWLALSARETWQKILLWLIIAYEIVILYATETRGAILGLFLGLAVIFFLTALSAKRSKIRMLSIGMLLSLIILGGTFFALRDTEFVKSTPGLRRIMQISRTDITTESRLLTWQASWQGWQDRFWQGYGYENFNVAFNKYFPAEIYRDAGSQIWFDRAHNIFFDVAVASGFFGILTYLSIFVLSLRTLYRHYRKNPQENRTTAIVFFALLVSYFFQNLFVFDTLGTYIAFYSIIAFFVFLQTEVVTEGIRVARKQTRQQVYEPARLNPYLAVILVAVAGTASYFAVYRPVQANTRVTAALYSAHGNQFIETVENYRRVIELNTYVNEEARQKLGEAVITLQGGSGASSEARQREARYAIEQLRMAIDAAPQDARNYLFLMAVYNNAPIQDPLYKEAVLRLGREAIKLSPDRPQIYFEMGQAAHVLGRFDEAIGYFETAVEKNPAAADSHWNLALVNILSGRPEEALSEIDYIFSQRQISIIASGNIANMINYLSQLGAYDQLPRLYEELLRRDPDNETLRTERERVLEILSASQS